MDELTDYSKDILLAEDDLEDVEIFEMALQELNISYTLRHAANGEVLFTLLKEKLPYILFLDINMPCKDGIACIIAIRKNRKYDQLPVIMYTSHQSKTVIDECFRNGANLYLGKTNTIRELTEKLKKIFAVDWENYLHYPPQDQFVLD